MDIIGLQVYPEDAPQPRKPLWSRAREAIVATLRPVVGPFQVDAQMMECRVKDVKFVVID
jgi:hypothetical protein